MLLMESVSGVCSKLASAQPFLSFRFCLCYAGMVAILGIYAVGWQQVIKHIPLTTAYANKAVTVVWGAVWGILLFHEKLSAGKLIGAILVIIGVVLFATADREVPYE